MKTWQKVGIGVGAAIVLGGVVIFSITQANKGVVTVQTATVGRQDLSSIVTASGEVKPQTYTNVLGQGIGLITSIRVAEGDHVKKGDVLLQTDSTQPAADVAAQKANIDATEAGVASAKANDNSAQADVKSATATFTHAKLDFDRAEKLFEQGLIAKSEFDSSKATFDGATAALTASQARAQAARAQLDQSQFSLTQTKAMLNRLNDVLKKMTYTAPIDGVVTYIAVRVGENVVPGIQNSTGSYLMTISDMSVVTAEVMVDETDIVNVKTDEPADVTVDALPNKIFKGHVTEVGTQAVLRSSGLASTQSTTGNQEAKDFKVVVRLDNPPPGLRPGLSTTAKITTAQKQKIVTIPIQALAVRTQKDLDEAAKLAGHKSDNSVTLAASRPADASSNGSAASKNPEIQGVFVIRNNKAEFVPVITGISGITDIEVLSGVKDGDQIVTGSYKALRTLKPDTPVKIDNTVPQSTDNSGS